MAAYAYARDVIKGRWPEAEPFMYNDAGEQFAYYNSFLKMNLSAEDYHKFSEDTARYRMTQ